MEITVKQGQTVYDVALIAYGDPSAIYDLSRENPTINVSATADLTGLTLTYTQRTTTRKVEAVKNITVPPKVVTISDSQNLFDLALQYYGKPESVYKLLAENSTIEGVLIDQLAGKTLTYTESKEFIPVYFVKNQLTVATKYPSIFETRITEESELRITENLEKRRLET